MQVLGCACPHPPLLVPEVGGVNRLRIQATVDAMQALADEIGCADLVVIISPHMPGRDGAFLVRSTRHLAGDFGQFGRPQARLEFENDLDFVERLLETADGEDVTLLPVEDGRLDHGVLVPMTFIEARRLVSLSIAGRYEAHRSMGALVRRCADERGSRVVFVASGDLSHRLAADGPYGFDRRGPVFDELVVDLVDRGDFEAIGRISPDVVEGAGECGLRSLIALGAFLGDDAQLDPRVLSYEGPFGVGYLVAAFGRGQEA
jgi:MEMO1 family protein